MSTELTDDQLAQIRERDLGDLAPYSYNQSLARANMDRRSLLALIDHQAAEIARMREALDACYSHFVLILGWDETDFLVKKCKAALRSAP